MLFCKMKQLYIQGSTQHYFSVQSMNWQVRSVNTWKRSNGNNQPCKSRWQVLTRRRVQRPNIYCTADGLVAYDGPELEPRARRLLGRWDELDHTLDLSHKGRGGHMGPSNFMYNFYREFLNFDCPMPYATEQNQPWKLTDFVELHS